MQEIRGLGCVNHMCARVRVTQPSPHIIVLICVWDSLLCCPFRHRETRNTLCLDILELPSSNLPFEFDAAFEVPYCRTTWTKGLNGRKCQVKAKLATTKQATFGLRVL